MTDTSLADLLCAVRDPADRVRHSRSMVTGYYRLVTDLYRAGWGDNHHFPPMRPDETLQDAVARCDSGLADSLRLAPGDRVLDIGSGIGGPATTIARHTGARVTGVDLSPERLVQAARLAEDMGQRRQVSFLRADAVALPFSASTFDAVYTLEALCHVPDETRVHAEVFRILRPGGHYAGHDWLCADGLTSQQLTQFIEPVCRNHCIPGLTTPARLRRDLAEAGFTDVVVAPLTPAEDMERTWGHLEQALALAADIDDPVIRFMADGGRALVDAARAGHFLIGRWHCTVPHRNEKPAHDSLGIEAL